MPAPKIARAYDNQFHALTLGSLSRAEQSAVVILALAVLSHRRLGGRKKSKRLLLTQNRCVIRCRLIGMTTIGRRINVVPRTVHTCNYFVKRHADFSGIGSNPARLAAPNRTILHAHNIRPIAKRINDAARN